jgi:hypothetical protein
MTTTLLKKPTIELTAADRADIRDGIPIQRANLSETLSDELRWLIADANTTGAIRRWNARRNFVADRIPSSGETEFTGEKLYRVIDVIKTGKSNGSTVAAKRDWLARRDALWSAVNAAQYVVA